MLWKRSVDKTANILFFRQRLAYLANEQWLNVARGQRGFCSETSKLLRHEYDRVKALVTGHVAPTVINPKGVFANNELNLGNVHVYGFDYDYTLAVYKKDVNNLIYELGRERLIENSKYPAGLKDMPYDPQFAVRGLHYDIDRCILLKLDAYYQVQRETAYRGKQKLSDEELRLTYNGFYVPQDYIESGPEDEKMKHLLDMFSLPEIGLLSNVVEYFRQNNIDFDSGAMFHDVQSAIRQVHFSGQLYSEICGHMEKYIHKNPGLLEFFERLTRAGKVVFIVTNSPFSFINAGLGYLLGDDWRRHFHYVIVQARKPQFFTDRKKPFRLYREDTSSPSWEKITELKRGNIYAEGNLERFLEMASLSNQNVLYFGDHMHSDLAEPMLKLGWHTAAIVPELEREIETQNSHLYQSSVSWLVALTWLIERFEDSSQADMTSQMILRSWHTERIALMHRLKAMFNPHFGSIFRTFHHPTYFSRRLMRLADIYTSRLPNLLQYSIQHTFYARRFALAHEFEYGVPH